MFDDEERPFDVEEDEFYDWLQRQFSDLVLKHEIWSIYPGYDLACDRVSDCWYRENVGRREEYIYYRLRNPTKKNENLLVYCDVCFSLPDELSRTVELNEVMLGYCFTPYQRLWIYHGAPLVAFYDTLGIRRTYSRLKPPASSRGN